MGRSPMPVSHRRAAFSGALAPVLPSFGSGRTLLFIDPVCEAPYTDRTVYSHALRQSQVALVRVAEGLAQRGHRVIVAQARRYWPERSAGGVQYVPFDPKSRAPGIRTDAVVVLRQSKALRAVRRAHPEARLMLWVDREPGRRAEAMLRHAASARATVVTATDAARTLLRRTLVADVGPIERVHHPVDDVLRPDGTRVVPDKLVVASASSAGLAGVLAAFRTVRERRPRARLFVLGEGPDEQREGVVSLGPLPHRLAVRHVREAFCVFQPHPGALGTHGLSLAEANALGTPVLAHASDVAQELLGESLEDGRQLVDARPPSAAADRLAAWWDGDRPRVQGRSRFALGRVLTDWERLAGADRQRAAIAAPTYALAR